MRYTDKIHADMGNGIFTFTVCTIKNAIEK